MWIFLSAVGLLFALVAAALASEVHVRVKYVREGEDDELDAAVTAFFGLVRRRYRVPAIELKPMLQGMRLKLVHRRRREDKSSHADVSKEEVEAFLQRTRLLLLHMRDYKDWFAGVLHHIHVTQFRWETEFGLGGAPETGWFAGVAWGVKSAVVGIACRWFTFRERPELRVVPDFQRVAFRASVVFRAKARMFRLIMGGCMLLLRILRVRGGWKVWVTHLFRTARGGDEAAAPR